MDRIKIKAETDAEKERRREEGTSTLHGASTTVVSRFVQTNVRKLCSVCEPEPDCKW